MSAKQIWLCALLLPVFTLFAEGMCLWPAPRFLGMASWALLSIANFAILVVLLAIVGSVYFAIVALFQWKKNGQFVPAIAKSLGCMLFIGLFLLAMLSAQSLRHRAFVQASHVGDRLVQALSRYKYDKGEFPENLNALLTDYLDEIPFTGMIGYPNFAYRKDRNDLEAKPGEYELRINCSSGLLNFDRFIYWPSEKYPDRIQGNGIERIRNWAYVHE